MITLNNTYFDYQKINVDSCKIELSHFGKQIEAEAKLVVTNKHKQTIDTILLSLNPSLTITDSKINGKHVSTIREMQLIKIAVPSGIKHNQKTQVSLSYQGTINENTCF